MRHRIQSTCNITVKTERREQSNLTLDPIYPTKLFIAKLNYLYDYAIQDAIQFTLTSLHMHVLEITFRTIKKK